MPLAGQEGHRKTGGEEGLALSPTTSAEHSTVSWPNCNSICSTRPTTLGMGRERSPQSMADTSSSLWDTRGLLPQVEEEEEKQDFSLMAVLLGLIGNRPTKGGIFHTACLEADSTRKTIRRCPFGFLTAEAKHQLGSFALQYTQTE